MMSKAELTLELEYREIKELVEWFIDNELQFKKARSGYGGPIEVRDITKLKPLFNEFAYDQD